MKKKQNIIHKKLLEIPAFKAGDDTLLKEVLHPKNDNIDCAFSLASASLGPGECSLPHRLTGSETYFFTAGQGSIFIEGKEHKVASGHVVFVPPNAEQYVRNDGGVDLEFLCIVSPAWSEDGEEVF